MVHGVNPLVLFPTFNMRISHAATFTVRQPGMPVMFMLRSAFYAHWGNIRAIFVLCEEKKMETIIMGYMIGYLSGLYRDNGKYIGNS